MTLEPDQSADELPTAELQSTPENPFQSPDMSTAEGSTRPHQESWGMIVLISLTLGIIAAAVVLGSVLWFSNRYGLDGDTPIMLGLLASFFVGIGTLYLTMSVLKGRARKAQNAQLERTKILENERSNRAGVSGGHTP